MVIGSRIVCLGKGSAYGAVWLTGNSVWPFWSRAVRFGRVEVWILANSQNILRLKVGATSVTDNVSIVSLHMVENSRICDGLNNWRTRCVDIGSGVHTCRLCKCRRICLSLAVARKNYGRPVRVVST